MNLLNRNQFLIFSPVHLLFKFWMTIVDFIVKESRVQCFLSRLNSPVLLYTLLPVHMNELESQNHHAWSAADKKYTTWSMKERCFNKSYLHRPVLRHWLHNVNCINVEQISYSFSNQWQLQKWKLIKRQRIQVAVKCTEPSVMTILDHCNELLIWILLNINFDLTEASC